MKHSINYLRTGIVLGVMAFVANGFEKCDDYGSYYTYCDDGYECCVGGCCLSSGGLSSDLSSGDLSPGIIVGIVAGSIVALLFLVACCYKLCPDEEETLVRPVPANTAFAVQTISTGNESPTMLHSPPNSSPVPTDQTSYYLTIPGAAGP